MLRSSENKDRTVKHKQPEEAPSAPRPTGQPVAPTSERLGPPGTAEFWERTEVPLLPPKRQCNFIHPKQLSPFPERLELPFPIGEILSGYEDVVSSRQDRYTTWVKTDAEVTLERHMVDVQKAVAEYRESAARRQESTTEEYFFDNHVPKRSYVEKRLSVYNWNPGPRRGKEGAIEQIIGKWHVIALQEEIDYVDHELLTYRFHVSHYGGCAVLFNKDTFFREVEVKSIYLHDTRRELPDEVIEGDQGWVLRGALSRASFSRQPLSGQKILEVLSLHIGNIYAKKRGIGKKLILSIRAVMLGEHVDLVADDFQGAAWRCSNRCNISTIEKASADCALRTPPGPTPLWEPGSVPGCGADEQTCFVRNLKTGSSSCQFTTDGRQKETKNNVNTISRQLQIMLANSLAVIGLSWSMDQKNGTEPTPTNPTDPGTK